LSSQHLLKKKPRVITDHYEVLFTPGDPAALSLNLGLRPEVLRPTLSGGLPFSSKNHETSKVRLAKRVPEGFYILDGFGNHLRRIFYLNNIRIL
jgi:hypothetical protein